MVHLPEPLSLVVKWARVAPIGGLVELGEQGLAGFLAGVVGKLHSNRFCSTAGLLAIQTFDCFFCLNPLIKSDESHPSGHSWERERAFVNSEQTKLVKIPRKIWAESQQCFLGNQPTCGARAEPGFLNLSHPSKCICLPFCRHGSGLAIPGHRTQAYFTSVPSCLPPPPCSALKPPFSCCN